MASVTQKKGSDADKSNSDRTAKGKYQLFSPFFRKTVYFFIGLLHWNVLVCQSLEKCNTLMKKGSPFLIYSLDSSNCPFTDFSISLSMFHFYSICLSFSCQRKNCQQIREMFTDTWDLQGPMYTELGRIFMFHVLQWNLKRRLEIKKTDSNSFPNPNW